MSSNIPDEVLPLLPDEYYDPSEIVLIGSHMKPSPDLEVDEDASKPTIKKAVDIAQLSCGHMRLRSDFADQLHLTAIPNKNSAANTDLASIDAMTNDKTGGDLTTAQTAKKLKIDEVIAETPTLALIYAYGYEGHTYRLSKPRIMIVQGQGRPYESQRDKDPSQDLTGKLYMWKLSKHHQTISIEVESGELEQLVLEANQPGNRSVTSYSAHMQMAHRGGKLS